jgi:hypothetical protein
VNVKTAWVRKMKFHGFKFAVDGSGLVRGRVMMFVISRRGNICEFGKRGTGLEGFVIAINGRGEGGIHHCGNRKCGIMDEVSESSFVAWCSVVSLVVGSSLNVVMGFSRRFLDFCFCM